MSGHEILQYFRLEDPPENKKLATWSIWANIKGCTIASTGIVINYQLYRGWSS